MMVMEERLTADSAIVGVCTRMVGLGDYAKWKICTCGSNLGGLRSLDSKVSVSVDLRVVIRNLKWSFSLVP